MLSLVPRPLTTAMISKADAGSNQPVLDGCCPGFISQKCANNLFHDEYYAKIIKHRCTILVVFYRLG